MVELNDTYSYNYIDVLDNATEEIFAEVYAKRQPVVLRGLDVGPCVEKWTVEHMAEKEGRKPVTVHVSQTSQMDFVNQNYSVESLPFCDLVKRASQPVQTEFFEKETEKYYLRAIADDPTTDTADIRKQYPDLASEIKIPPFFPEEKFFSSVFRIASNGLQLWTHYDVMDNILMQIRGRKRVVFFHPKHINCLYMKGSKSTVFDIDNVDEKKYPLFSQAERYEVILEPGDVLFIPALWLHNVMSLEFGVAVNVFWKHLDDSLYDTTDTYANKDPLPADRAYQHVDNAMKALEDLPLEYQDFYVKRLIKRLEQNRET